MARSAAPTESEPADAAGPTPDAIREALAIVLASNEFRASKRSQEFLRFVVEQTLAGRATEVKERTIGVEVFGRTPSYDTNEDGIVRIKASEVRRRLGLYYATEGKSNKIRIELPVGGYAPHFTLPSAAAVNQASPDSAALHRPRTKLYIGLLSVGVAVALCTAWFAFRTPASGLLERFWAPLLRSPGTVLIAAAYVPVYERESASDTSRRFHSEQRSPGEYLLLSDQYVGGGDLVAATRISGLLASMHRSYDVRVGTTAFQDLKSAPTVLIGYSSDQWAAVSSRLRYFIDDEHGVITDNGKPTSWRPRNLSRQFHTDEDYAIISRVFDAQTHTMRVEVTGITQYGTEGAAEVVTNSDLLRDVLKDAGPQWKDRNLQLILRMNVIQNYPATPKLIATYYW